ncbi:Imm32 family immunity protein [Microbulbifer sp. Q7]|uniref:Imm32 family immunity protein n=1 Tax=Microbulbifer sp. Q7 TaxID=1785091 RepID=UPI000ADF759B
MLTVERDEECEQIYIHGSPDRLRWLASRLQAIANEAEKSGQSHDHLMSEDWGGSELSNELQGKKESHSIVNHLIVYGWAKR